MDILELDYLDSVDIVVNLDLVEFLDIVAAEQVATQEDLDIVVGLGKVDIQENLASVDTVDSQDSAENLVGQV